MQTTENHWTLMTTHENTRKLIKYKFKQLNTTENQYNTHKTTIIQTHKNNWTPLKQMQTNVNQYNTNKTTNTHQ